MYLIYLLFYNELKLKIILHQKESELQKSINENSEENIDYKNELLKISISKNKINTLDSRKKKHAIIDLIININRLISNAQGINIW